jgi:hypothetical protein
MYKMIRDEDYFVASICNVGISTEKVPSYRGRKRLTVRERQNIGTYSACVVVVPVIE